MNLGNLLQALALMALCIFTHSEYQNRRTLLENNIQALRVQKSFSGRQSFEYLYGPDWKNVIKQKLQENKDELAVNWNSTTKKIILILVLGCISAFHFIRYFYIDFEEDETYLREHYKYDAATWFINFIFFAITAAWALYFTRSIPLFSLGYVIAIFSLMGSLACITRLVEQKKPATFNRVKVMQLTVSVILYFHIIAFVVAYYGVFVLRIPVLTDLFM